MVIIEQTSMNDALETKAAVLAAKKKSPCAGGCPGSAAKVLTPKPEVAPVEAASQLRQWPVQIKLVPVNAPYFHGSDLLVAADCTAYAYSRFHEDFIKNHVTVIGCTKLDATDYSQKLAEIFRQNAVRSVTVVRMEVPCCGGMEHAAKSAIQSSGKEIPCHVVTISTDGRLLS